MEVSEVNLPISFLVHLWNYFLPHPVINLESISVQIAKIGVTEGFLELLRLDIAVSQVIKGIIGDFEILIVYQLQTVSSSLEKFTPVNSTFIILFHVIECAWSFLKLFIVELRVNHCKLTAKTILDWFYFCLVNETIIRWVQVLEVLLHLRQVIFICFQTL